MGASILAKGTAYAKPEGESAPGTLKAHKRASVAEELESRRWAEAEVGDVMRQKDHTETQSHCKDFAFYFEKKWGGSGGFCKEERCGLTGVLKELLHPLFENTL